MKLARFRRSFIVRLWSSGYVNKPWKHAYEGFDFFWRVPRQDYSLKRVNLMICVVLLYRIEYSRFRLGIFVSLHSRCLILLRATDVISC